jgi:hypothetical protein
VRFGAVEGAPALRTYPSRGKTATPPNVQNIARIRDKTTRSGAALSIWRKQMLKLENMDSARVQLLSGMDQSADVLRAWLS